MLAAQASYCLGHVVVRWIIIGVCVVVSVVVVIVENHAVSDDVIAICLLGVVDNGMRGPEPTGCIGLGLAGGGARGGSNCRLSLLSVDIIISHTTTATIIILNTDNPRRPQPVIEHDLLVGRRL